MRYARNRKPKIWLSSRGFVVLVMLLVFYAVVITSSCDNFLDNSDADLSNPNCARLTAGIIDLDGETVKSEINKLVIDLAPAKTATDLIGHEGNIHLLIERLNTRCSNLSAQLICYACIKTNPPQSEILLTADSPDTVVSRVIDISTPEDAILDCIRVHE